MYKTVFALILILVTLITACGPATPAALPTSTAALTATPGILYVDPEFRLGEINPLVYGTNYGPWVAVPYDMISYAEQAGVTVIRYPGGSWGDNNNLLHSQIDQFIAFCRQMGALPYLHVRLKNGTPEAAAELVRYANVEMGYDVRYWSIGNEPTLFADSLQEAYDTDRFNQEWRTFAEAMKAVDSEILLVGPELHQFTANYASNPKDSQGRDWMTEFLRANGDLVDIVSFHRYPFPLVSGEAVTIEQLRRNSAEWDQTIPYLRNLIHEITGRDIPIAVTEVNSHWNKSLQGEATPDSLYNAIWWADVLGRMINQGLYMVNHWLLTSSGSQGAWGIITRGDVRPSYYVYTIYGHFGNQLIYAASGVPDVSIYAAEREDGTLTIIVINLGDNEQHLPLELAGGAPDTAEVWLLDATHNAENLGVQPFLDDGQLLLPAQSVTLYVLER